MPQRWQTGPGGRWIWSCIILALPPSGSVISDHLFYLRESLSCKIVYNNLYRKCFWQRSNEIMQQSTKYDASHTGKKRRNTLWWLRLKKISHFVQIISWDTKFGSIGPGIRKMGFQPPFCPWTTRFVSLDLNCIIYRWPAHFYLKGLGEHEIKTTQVKVSSSVPGIERSVILTDSQIEWLPFMWFNEGNILKQDLKLCSLSTFSKWPEFIIANNSALASPRVTAMPGWKEIILRKIDH